jgi:hypothetical protein
VRLWVGHDKLIDDWTELAASRNTLPLELVAGKKYAIKIEYYEASIGAEIQLKWLPPGSSDFTVIPLSQLYSTDTYGYDDLIDYLAYLEEPPRDDFAALNQGQLKYIADLFYARLLALGYQGAPLAGGQTRPWTTNVTSDDDDYALVNLGQLKRVFSFSLPSQTIPNVDADNDGYPDATDAYPADPSKHAYLGALSVTLLAPTGATLLP